MIGLALPEDFFRVYAGVLVHLDLEHAVPLPVNVHPVLQRMSSGNLVDVPCELPRSEILGIVALFEVIELFENGYGNYYIVFFKVFDCKVVIDDDRSVEYKNLSVCLLHIMKELKFR